MADSRKKYSREFKVEAARMLEAGEKGGREIEKDLGIGSGQVHRWRKELGYEAILAASPCGAVEIAASRSAFCSRTRDFPDERAQARADPRGNEGARHDRKHGGFRLSPSRGALARSVREALDA